MESVMELARVAFAGETLARVSAWLGESPAGTQAAVQDAVPLSLFGLASQASGEEGSRALLDHFQRGSYPRLEPDELGRAVNDPDAADRLVQSNQGFLDQVFGGNLNSVVDGMADHTAVSRSAIAKLLGLAAPLVLGLIGNRTLSERLDASGLRSFLAEQGSIAAGQLPVSLTRLLPDPADAAYATGGQSGAPASDAPDDRRRVSPWWLIGLLAPVVLAR